MEREHNDLEFMKDTSRWPNMILPIKNSRQKNPKHPNSIRVAVLAANFPGSKLFVAMDVNMFDREELKNAKFEPTTAEQLVADGWVVD